MSHPNYLAFFRQRNGLSAQELADLIGYSARSTVRRAELGERDPTLPFALACQAVFGIPPAQMFPGLYGKIEEEVLNRGALLDHQLRGQPGEQSALKRRLLTDIVERSSQLPAA